MDGMSRYGAYLDLGLTNVGKDSVVKGTNGPTNGWLAVVTSMLDNVSDGARGSEA